MRPIDAPTPIPIVVVLESVLAPGVAEPVAVEGVSVALALALALVLVAVDEGESEQKSW